MMVRRLVKRDADVHWREGGKHLEEETAAAGKVKVIARNRMRT